MKHTRNQPCNACSNALEGMPEDVNALISLQKKCLKNNLPVPFESADLLNFSLVDYESMAIKDNLLL